MAAQADGADKVFVCWEDGRNLAYSGDTDLYFAEVSPGALSTNVLVGDGRANSDQQEAALGVDRCGYPYIVWTDDAGDGARVYHSGATYPNPVSLVEKEISASLGDIVGAPPESVSTLDDVSVVMPAGACSFDTTVTVARVNNPQGYATESLRVYDFGPSGLVFAEPVTITIPYPVRGTGKARAYWFSAATGTFSDGGVTDVEDITIRAGLHALRFKTTHFTPYYVVAADPSGASGNGGGGGCSLAAHSDGDVAAYFAPYLLIAAVMFVWRRGDVRRRKDAPRPGGSLKAEGLGEGFLR